MFADFIDENDAITSSHQLGAPVCVPRDCAEDVDTSVMQLPRGSGSSRQTQRRQRPHQQSVIASANVPAELSSLSGDDGKQ